MVAFSFLCANKNAQASSSRIKSLHSILMHWDSVCFGFDLEYGSFNPRLSFELGYQFRVPWAVEVFFNQTVSHINRTKCLFCFSLQPVDCGRQGWSRDAKANVYSSRQSRHWRAVDVKSGLVSQAETHQQHFRQKRTGKSNTATTVFKCHSLNNQPS